jgi:hypothetical protein
LRSDVVESEMQNSAGCGNRTIGGGSNRTFLDVGRMAVEFGERLLNARVVQDVELMAGKGMQTEDEDERTSSWLDWWGVSLDAHKRKARLKRRCAPKLGI